MRQVQDGGAPPDPSFVHSLETCVQCRGCETACPSGVPFGRLIEPARQTLAEGGGRRRSTALLALRAGVRALRWHRLVLAGSTLLAAASACRWCRPGCPGGWGCRRCRCAARLRPTGDDVWLFTGCVMGAWMRDARRRGPRGDRRRGRGGAGAAGRLVLRGAGPACRPGHRGPGHGPPDDGGLPGDVLVDSAGCGAALKDYGHLLGTPEAAAFGARVRDVHEWLAEHPRPSGDRDRPPHRGRPGPVPPAPRPARPRRGAHGPVPRRPPGRAGRRGPVLRGRGRLRRRAARPGRRHPRSQAGRHRPGRRRPWPPPAPVALHLAAPASRSSTPAPWGAGADHPCTLVARAL